MSYYSNQDNIFEQARRAIDYIGKANFVRNLLPNGKMESHEWIAINPNRIDKKLGSFRTNTISGRWADFSSGEKGGDLISLYAFIKRIDNYTAACEIVGVERKKRKY